MPFIGFDAFYRASALRIHTVIFADITANFYENRKARRNLKLIKFDVELPADLSELHGHELELYLHRCLFKNHIVNV